MTTTITIEQEPSLQVILATLQKLRDEGLENTPEYKKWLELMWDWEH